MAVYICPRETMGLFSVQSLLTGPQGELAVSFGGEKVYRGRPGMLQV